jgi:hypothetical protein
MIKRKETKHILSLSSLAPGAKSNLLDCETLDLSNVSALTITVRVTHHPSATKPVLVHVVSGVDTMTFDTIDYATFECHLLPGAESQTTKAITPDVLYLKVQLENQDTSYAATDLDVWAVLGYED